MPAVTAIWWPKLRAKITGNLQIATDQNSGWVSGRVAGHVEAVWWAEILADTAPETKGKWRLADQPGKPGNSGGSFLAVPATCKDPEAAFAFLSWLTTPANQATSFNDVQLFPSTPASPSSGYGQHWWLLVGKNVLRSEALAEGDLVTVELDLL